MVFEDYNYIESLFDDNPVQVRIFSSDETQEIRERFEKKMEKADRDFKRHQARSAQDARNIYLTRAIPQRRYHSRP